MMKLVINTSMIALSMLALSITPAITPAITSTSIQYKDANFITDLKTDIEVNVEKESYQQLASQQLRQMDLFNPRFNDLYIIESHAKNRDVIVYCNAAYCYKKRYEKLAV